MIDKNISRIIEYIKHHIAHFKYVPHTSMNITSQSTPIQYKELSRMHNILNNFSIVKHHIYNTYIIHKQGYNLAYQVLDQPNLSKT